MKDLTAKFNCTLSHVKSNCIMPASCARPNLFVACAFDERDSDSMT